MYLEDLSINRQDFFPGEWGGGLPGILKHNFKNR
jgi:hypothetical protein